MLLGRFGIICVLLFHYFKPSPLVQIQGGTEAVNFNAYKCTKDLPKEDRVWLLSYGFIFKKMQAYVKQNLAGGLKWQYQGEEYTFGEGK